MYGGRRLSKGGGGLNKFVYLKMRGLLQRGLFQNGGGRGNIHHELHVILRSIVLHIAFTKVIILKLNSQILNFSNLVSLFPIIFKITIGCACIMVWF